MNELYESFNDVYTLLPVKFYKHDLTGNYIYSPLHWHRSLEITIPLDGRICFNTGSNSFDYGEADWLFVNSCELHSCRYIAPEDHFVGISIIISKPFIDKWLGRNLFFFNPEVNEVTSRIKEIAREMYALDQSSEGYNYTVMSRLFELLSILSSKCTGAAPVSVVSESEASRFSDFIDYIEAHYMDDLSLDSVAEHFRYTPSYFSRLFKKAMGVGFHSYLSFVRASHAAESLSTGNDNLTECAFNNGFPNMKSFINTFKKIYGCTPSNFLVAGTNP